MAAFRTLWMALVSLYEETLVLVGANLAAVGINLPLGGVLFAVGLILLPSADTSYTQLLVLVIASLLPFIPTPGNVALAGLTRVAAGPDVPRFFQFRATLRERWVLALRCCVVRGSPYGGSPWVEHTAEILGLQATLRPRGRPSSTGSPSSSWSGRRSWP